jgi:hypothetical protein
LNASRNVLKLWQTRSVVAELLRCRTLKQRVVGSNPGEGTGGVFEQDTLKSTARVAIISRIACSTPNLSKNKKTKNKTNLMSSFPTDRI